MACGISFLSDNNVKDAVISLTAGTVNAQFPISNIKNDATVKMFRSNENNVVLLFDLQQTRTLDTVAIAGDGTNTLGLTSASIKTSLTTDFSGATAIPVPLSGEYNMGYEYFTAVDHRYVELTLAGTGSFVELSTIFLGQRINIEQNNLSIGSFRYGYTDTSEKRGNKYGTQFVDKRNKIKFITGGLEFCTKTEHDVLDEMFLRHGRSEPLWMIVDKDGESMTDGQYRLTIYGYFDKSPRWSAAGGQHYNATVRVDQAI